MEWHNKKKQARSHLRPGVDLHALVRCAFSLARHQEPCGLGIDYQAGNDI
jgi:hypothetical protein